MKKKKRKKKKKNPLRSNLQTIQGPPLDCKSYTVFFARGLQMKYKNT